MPASRAPSLDVLEASTRERATPAASHLRDSRWRLALLNRITAAWELVGGFVLLLAVGSQIGGPWELFAILLLFNLLAERTPLPIYGETVITIGFVFTMAIIALVGPPGAAIAGAAEVIVRRAGNKPLATYVTLRSAGRATLVYTTAAYVYQLIASGAGTSTFELLIGGLCATVVTFALSALLLTIRVAHLTEQPLTTVWANQRWIAPHYLALGVVGIAVTAAHMALGYWGILFFLTPAFMLRLSMKQYVEKTADNVEKLKEQNRALEVANVEIRKVSEELKVTYNATLEALVNALEARDQETKGHSVRVARYMLNIAEALGVQPETPAWLDMHHGALMHDVGKIGVRDNILLKPGKLTPEEWELMRLHPEIGYNILREVNFMKGAAEIVLAHHERWDGAGYPKGLRAEEIPLGSRIFSVVDTFDSMTWDRVYRKAMTTQEALNEILRCSGTQFDPLVVEAFLDIYDAWVIERDHMQDLATVRAA